MRLLHAASLKFKEFPDAAIPPYAILSHTWEDKQEVTLQDMASLYLTDKTGYAKIAATCALALQRGLAWAWIDTCCIDKTNNTELTESINSMFTWYQNAAVCFVHLVDLDTSPAAAAKSDNTAGGGGGNDVYQRMRQCAWFKRGWTLQELLAPTNVEFYDTHWSPFGSKADLAPLLAEITHIPVPVILGQERLTYYSAAQIMAWASRRATTRVEDEAYCLLGLFDVYMPLIYGEGKRAFQRLQEEILKRTTDLTLFAWLTPEEAAVVDIETAHSIQGLPPSNRGAFMPLLASSPASFEHCRGLSRFRNDDSEFAVTNRGLRITTYLMLVPLSTEFAEGSQSAVSTSPAQRIRHSHHPSIGSGASADSEFGFGGSSASNSPTPPIGMESAYRKPTAVNQHTRYRYVLSVGFSRSAGSEIGIWLKKVGPGLFLRDAHLSLAFLSKSKLRYINTTENLTFYIMPQPMSSLPSSKVHAHNSRMSMASLATTLPPTAGPAGPASSVLSPMSPHGGGFDSPLLQTHVQYPPNQPESGLSAHQQLCSVYHPRLYPRGMYIPDFRDRNISFAHFPPQPWDEYTRIYCQPESRNDVVAFSCSSRQGPDGRDKLSFGVLVDHRIKRDGPRCLVINRHHMESRLLFMHAMRQQGEPLRWYALQNELPLLTASTNILRMTIGTRAQPGGPGQSPVPASTRTYEVVASIVESRVQIDEHSVVMPTLDITITWVQ